VNQSKHFPCGAKTMYKAFAADGDIYEFVDDDNSPIQCSPVLTQCWWEPQIDRDISISVEGMYVIKQLPEGLIVPMEFVPGHSAYFEKVLGRVETFFKDDGIKKQWKLFAKEYPKHDKVDNFVREKGLHVPLREQLFPNLISPFDRTSRIQTTRAISSLGEIIVQEESPNYRRQISMPSVDWAGTRFKVPPRVPCSPDQLDQIRQGSLSKKVLLDELLKLPLSYAEYKKLSIRKLLERITARELLGALDTAKKSQRQKLNQLDYIQM
jgi:hypothetical protein